MSLNDLLSRLLGVSEGSSINDARVSFAAGWAQDGMAWIFLGCVILGILAFAFYLRCQARARRRARVLLATSRALLLSLIFLFLAEPILVVELTTHPDPMLWVLFDGTESMSIEDRLSAAQRRRLDQAVGRESGRESPSAAGSPSRMDYVHSLVAKKDDNLLRRLSEKYRLRGFSMERADGVRALQWDPEDADSGDSEDSDDSDDSAYTELQKQLTANGKVTAIGAAFEDLARRPDAGNLGALLMLSDFDQNAGPTALAAARRLSVPVYTIGFGPSTTVDIGVDLHAPLLSKKSERVMVSATLRQSGLNGQTVDVVLTSQREDAARPLARTGVAATADGEAKVVARKSVTLHGPTVSVEFPYTAEETGRHTLIAAVERQEGEVVDENNTSRRGLNVRDDFLRLMFVEYEPTWEWRFVKEVFHRDKLVGLRGFRTFLRSADPRVRETNDLFLPTIAPPRSEFFPNDVLMLGDMPAAALTERFCEMTREWVSRFGGGLVVIAGPRYGPGALADTSLADMLPVVVDPTAKIRSRSDFVLRRTPAAAEYEFMQLGGDDEENERAWKNLGKLPWYQPVARVHPLGSVLAEHPTAKCIDGKTPQPLIAIRRFGRGEVVYLAFNEMWRLRRRYGERYYRQFWGQMIHRLGLSHALGAEKRFVVRVDRPTYQVDETAIVTVEAYDENYQPLTSDALDSSSRSAALQAELLVPTGGADGGSRARRLEIPQRRPGVFERRITLVAAGEHRIKVSDPFRAEFGEAILRVERSSAERRSATRNVALEREIVLATGGKAYDLTTADKLPEELTLPERTETRVEILPLWNTWLCFVLVTILMLGEWLFRKLVNLP